MGTGSGCYSYDDEIAAPVVGTIAFPMAPKPPAPFCFDEDCPISPAMLVSVIDEAAPGGLNICEEGCPLTEFVAELPLLLFGAVFVLFEAA